MARPLEPTNGLLRSNDELSTNEEKCEKVYDNNLNEDEVEALPENNESLDELSPLEIHIIRPPPFVKDYTYQDPMCPEISPHHSDHTLKPPKLIHLRGVPSHTP